MCGLHNFAKLSPEEISQLRLKHDLAATVATATATPTLLELTENDIRQQNV